MPDAVRERAAIVSWNGLGLLNSITEFVDRHRRARSNDHRRDTAWFGQGAALKQKAWEEALRLVHRPRGRLLTIDLFQSRLGPHYLPLMS